MTTQLATVGEKFNHMRSFLEHRDVALQIAKALPAGVSAERLIRQVLTLMLPNNNPQLLDCSKGSIILGLLKSAELNLELSGPLGHAYLVPRRNKGVWQAVFQVGWRGLVALAYRSGQVASMETRLVHENDTFNIVYGTSSGLQHTPKLKDRGPVTGYYCVVKYVNGGVDFEYMSRDEVEAHRVKYKCGGPAWQTSFDSMAVKTVVRKLCARMSLCPQAQSMSMEEEYAEAGIPVGARVDMIQTAEAIDCIDVTPEETIDDAEVEEVA